MALEGSLKEFALADVIQLIANSQKSGVLLLKSRSDTASISFLKGKITATVYDRQGREVKLQDYLLRSKKVPPEKVLAMLQIQSDSNLPLDEVLIKEGVMTEDDVQRFIIFKVQEVLDEAFTWADASYAFDPDASLYLHSRTRVEIPVESLILESMRRKDEWPMIVQAISSERVVLQRQENPPADVELDPDAQQILEHIDGYRTVGQLMEITNLGRFRTYSAAYQLLQAGLALKLDTGAPAIERPAVPKKVYRTAAVWAATVTVTLITIGATLAAAWFIALRQPAGGSNLVLSVKAKIEQEPVRQKLDLYLLNHGRYPATLEEAGLGAAGASYNYVLKDSLQYDLERRR